MTALALLYVFGAGFLLGVCYAASAIGSGDRLRRSEWPLLVAIVVLWPIVVLALLIEHASKEQTP